MDLKKIISNMAREAFLEFGLIETDCPDNWRIDKAGNCAERISIGNCTDCWFNSLEKAGIKFKDEKSEKERVVESAKLINSYCENKKCDDCLLYVKEYGCGLDGDPCNWNLEGLHESKS